MKPYQTIPIRECGEPLVTLPAEIFRFYHPHVYVSAGAPYDGVSPWQVRQSIGKALLNVQKRLENLHSGWKLLFFDAYRPYKVQAYMVEREFRLEATKAGLDPENLTPKQREQLANIVYLLWAPPSDDPAKAPPHSTGAAIDLTFMDENRVEVNMGCPIDENSERARPNHFANADDPNGHEAHQNRLLLRDLMQAEGFQCHKLEWWHFSIGDQYWAWRQRENLGANNIIASYGRADLLS